ncbi:MAG: DEAD/DEAH box helicase [Actinomycetota bacterium]
MSTTFAQLGVPAGICAALATRGITEPFEIQAATIADTLAGRDLCGRAPTGSGKTLAFGVPLVALAERSESRRPRSLILAPTRELADQIASELKSFAGPVRVDVVYGGVGYGKQRSALRRGVDVLVACPGRLEDLVQGGDVSLDAVERVVLDEADRMADMGFLPAVRRILDQTQSDRQTLLFSATLDGDIAKLTEAYQRDPARHEVGDATPDITAAEHRFWNVERADRARVAAEAITAAWPTIVFTRTRHGADRLARQLGKQGVDAVAIHGGRNQNQRNKALADFSRGKAQALVATDVAARGIHVDDVASVLHFDPPEDHKAYVHRSGRTARGGAGGVVVSLVQPDQKKEVRRIQRAVGLEQQVAAPDASELRTITTDIARRAPRPVEEAAAPRPTPSRDATAKAPRSKRADRDRASAPRRPRNGSDANRGTVKFFDRKKGYGFIARDGQQDVFVHYSHIAGNGHRSLDEGQAVSFDLVPGRKGQEAHNVQPV